MKGKVAGFVFILLAVSMLCSCRGFFQPDDTNNNGGGSGGGGGTGATTAKFLYVTNSQSGSISGFTVGTNGALTAVPGTPFVGTTQPVDAAATPAGDILFVADSGQGIWSFVINRNDGTLPPATSVGQVTTTPIGVATANANFAYGLEQGVATQNVAGDVQPYNIIGGTLTPIVGTAQSLSTNPHTIRIDPSARLLYVAGDVSGTWIFAIQTAAPAGTLTTVGQVATTAGTVSRDVAIDPTTKFAFVANGSTGVETYTIGTDGNLTRLGGVTAAGTTPIRLAITPNGKFLYVINQGSNNISAYSVNSGALTSLGTIGTGSQPSAIAVDPSSAFVYVTNFVDGTLSAYSIGSTGALTANGNAINVGSGPSGIAILK